MNVSEAVPALRRALQDPEFEVRSKALLALGMMKAAEALPDIRALLRGDDEATRQEALSTLYAWKDPASAPDIIPLLSHDRMWMRLLAIRALQAVESHDALEAVAKRLRDPDRDVRVASAEYLCSLGSRDGVSTLLKEGTSLTTLNRLRRPEVWKDLGSRPFSRRLEGRLNELMRSLCREARMELREPRRCCDLEVLTSWDDCSTGVYGGGGTMLSAMAEAIGRDSYEMVLEPDRIVILSTGEARIFWTAWLAEESKTK
jgi:hypothetical protein